MVWSIGTPLKDNQYTIENILGQGRFGITYLVRDRHNNLKVIKTLNRSFFARVLNPSEFERLQSLFEKEAFILAKCHHPNIVKVEQPFKEQGISCIVLEYIDGITLDKRNQRILSETEALDYIQQVGEALIEVHRKNLLHRDIRPGNIMIRVREGKAEAILIDFGLALAFDHPLTQTRTEEIAEGFAPLELYSRNAPRGSYTDIYSLAATLYVLLTGETPVSSTKRKLDQVPLVEPKTLNHNISDRTNQAILCAMELDADKRPQSVEEWFIKLGVKKAKKSLKIPLNFSSINWATVWAAIGSIVAIIALLSQCQNNQPNPETTPSPTPSSTLNQS